MEDDWALALEVDARRSLSDRALRLVVLAPRGSWIGRGALRVLRVRTHEDESIELTAGYESYERTHASQNQ
ncbi:MAG: hypothetical protein JO092_01875 [Candidatus Eremiobacteraeota bacterium]|nr:hypothetical protein [Candidatus Eremiobacteraeota bacterium]